MNTIIEGSGAGLPREWEGACLSVRRLGWFGLHNAMGRNGVDDLTTAIEQDKSQRHYHLFKPALLPEKDISDRPACQGHTYAFRLIPFKHIETRKTTMARQLGAVTSTLSMRF